jgi:hypothetical protein
MSTKISAKKTEGTKHITGKKTEGTKHITGKKTEGTKHITGKKTEGTKGVERGRNEVFRDVIAELKVLKRNVKFLNSPKLIANLDSAAKALRDDAEYKKWCARRCAK